MSVLGTLEELPLDYRRSLTKLNLLPLWPSLRNFLPYGKPIRETTPILWRYDDIRPLLLLAGELTPIEKAERRVLVLANPGLGLEKVRATPTIYIGMQLILPGETAPNHRHTPSAIRFAVEGSGAYTIVEGEKLPMERGDLILTPPKLWHEHGHEGTGPVVWLDALDLPLIHDIEASYCIDGTSQQVANEPDASQTSYRRAGLLPYGVLDQPKRDFPLLRFPWTEVREALIGYARGCGPYDPVRLAYVNPETGSECLSTLGFSALMLRPGEEVALTRRSASSVFHVIEGRGEARVDETDIAWSEADTFAAPTHAEIRVRNNSSKSPAFLFTVDDAPLQRRLGFYEEFGEGGSPHG
jgi:gentisate 1,2-dioxygenase